MHYNPTKHCLYTELVYRYTHLVIVSKYALYSRLNIAKKVCHPFIKKYSLVNITKNKSRLFLVFVKKYKAFINTCITIRIKILQVVSCYKLMFKVQAVKYKIT